jgi:hypothetical protein
MRTYMPPKLNFTARGNDTLAGKLIPVKEINTVTPITSRSITKTPIGMRAHDLKRTDLLAFHVCASVFRQHQAHQLDCFRGNADGEAKLFPRPP